MNYNVTIKATIIKTIQVTADSEDAACEAAHGEFSVLNTGRDEHYKEETLSIEESE